MKVLSVRQPWAWLIAIGCKTIENRTWSRNYRGRILIHASQAKAEQLDGWQENAMRKYCQAHNIPIHDFDSLPKSAIIGSVEVSDIQFHEAYNDPFAEDFQYHWFLKNPRLFDNPIIGVKGKLFLWNYDLDEQNVK